MNSFQRPRQKPTFPGAPRMNCRHSDVVRENTSRSEAASIMGSASGGAKAAAAKKNGNKGGRPEGS